jgi:shikimate dehydrogenase
MHYAGVISAPGKRSLSPAFQQAAFDALDISVKYEHWETPADGLATRVTGLRAPSALGANVTVPHKEACVPLVDEADDLVRKAGALNTIHNVDGRLIGYNTDVWGFLGGLRDAGFASAGCAAVIAGAGGSAKAVAVALVGEGAASVTVVNRTLARARALVESFSGDTGRTALAASPDTREAWEQASATADLLINCTSLGAAGTPEEDESPVPSDLIRPTTLVYDLVYLPAETKLMRDARAAGARAVGGLPMLIYQGAASFEIWTGRDAPLEVMRKAAEAALAKGRP